MKLTSLLVILSLTLVGCSRNKTAKSGGGDSPAIELSETEEMSKDDSSNSAEEAEKVSEDQTGEENLDEDKDFAEDASANNDEIDINDELDDSDDEQSFFSGETKKYVVQKNETLMLIAFKLYGDHSKWRELANKNPKIVGQGGIVKAGSEIYYRAPRKEFVWQPNGNPYLIKTGDTLGTISKEVYQTMAKWKMLWENNRKMIKDPNKIYAGFTLYYLDAREIAAEL